LAHLTDDVRDLDLGGQTDDAVLNHPSGMIYALISADKGFSNLFRF